ncbi:hypothetical protein F0562_004804 [Nyssa sinensis]|uniref:Uncharacterized protein n=1 Tax=Nyssa sinensis TaxID=561372 RepID=A0A5J5AGA9_9ASTE|nr:hypothetical protein F0562_004804 [Nyssa sinensis]
MEVAGDVVDHKLADGDVDTNSNEEDGDEAKVDDGVDEDGDAAGLHVGKLHRSALTGKLEQQPRRQQHEQAAVPATSKDEGD